MRSKFFGVGFWLLASAGVAAAQTTNFDEHCPKGGNDRSLRQTVIVIDGSMVVPDTENGPAVENQSWRAFIRPFVDATDRRISQLMAPRERITVTLANGDGSGLSTLFSGCVPLWTRAEIDAAEASSSSLAKFFGRDWRTQLEKSQESFRRSATIATISGIKNVPIVLETLKSKFADSNLIASLRRNPGYSTDDGLVRYVILGDFANIEIPTSDIVTARRLGKSDGGKSGLDFKLSEVHLFGDGIGGEASKYQYIDGFFLATGGSLTTLGSLSSTISENNVPVTNRVFQGTADFPEIGAVPVRFRLATDENNRVVMSWFQEQRREARAIPVRGALTCESDGACNYQGDQTFAQVWSDNPNPEPECTGEMPMAGMRNLVFSVDGEIVSGSVTDTICIIRDREQEGLRFELRELKGNSG